MMKLKNSPEDQDVLDRVGANAAGELRSFIERIERLEAEKAIVALDLREVFAEAKSLGYDARVMRKVVALRKRDADDVAEEQAVMSMYLSALGMS